MSSPQTRVIINTSASTFELDMNQMSDRTFVGNVAFSGAKTVRLKNDTNAESILIDLPVTTSCTLTLPSNFTAPTTESRFVDGTKVLTLTGTGTYTIVGLYNGTVWKIKVSADGEFA